MTWWHLCSPQAVRIRTELGCRTPSGRRDAGRDSCCFCRTDGTEGAWGRAWPTPRHLRSLALASLGQKRFSGERGRDEKGRGPITPQAGPGSHQGGGCT